jgi:hypothetical protein
LSADGLVLTSNNDIAGSTSVKATLVGSGGGALADSDGQVIGMITTANTPSGQQSATGFAIPLFVGRLSGGERRAVGASASGQA